MIIDVELINNLMNFGVSFEEAFKESQGCLPQNALELYKEAVEKKNKNKTENYDSLSDISSSSDNDDDNDDAPSSSADVQALVLQNRMDTLRNFEDSFKLFLSTYSQNDYVWNRMNFFNSHVVEMINSSNNIPEVFNSELNVMVDFFSDILSNELYRRYISSINCSKILLWLMDQALSPQASDMIKNKVTCLFNAQFIFERYSGSKMPCLILELKKEIIDEFLNKYILLSLSDVDTIAFVNVLIINKIYSYKDILQLRDRLPLIFNDDFLSSYHHEQARNELNLREFTFYLDNLLKMTPPAHYKIELQKVIRHVILERKARHIDSNTALDRVLCKYTHFYNCGNEIPNDILDLLNQTEWSKAREYFNSQSFMAFSSIFLKRNTYPIQFHKLTWTQLYRIGTFIFGDKPELITNNLLDADYPNSLFLLNKIEKKSFILLKHNHYLFSTFMMPRDKLQDAPEPELFTSEHEAAHKSYEQERQCFYQVHGNNHLFLSFNSWEKLKKRDDIAQDVPLRQPPYIPKRLRYFFSISLNESSSKLLLEHDISMVI